MPQKNKKSDVFKFIDMSGGNDSCWNWKGALSTKGRPYFTVDGRKYIAYRLVYELVHGECPDDKMILHQCDNGQCCNPRHHKLGNQQENMDEMKQRERHGLPHHTIKTILKLKEAGRPHQEIADLFGIGRSTVSEIGVKNYTHVEKDE